MGCPSNHYQSESVMRSLMVVLMNSWFETSAIAVEGMSVDFLALYAFIKMLRN